MTIVVILPVPGPGSPDPYRNPGIVPPWLQKPGVPPPSAGVEDRGARGFEGAEQRQAGSLVDGLEVFDRLEVADVVRHGQRRVAADAALRCVYGTAKRPELHSKAGL